MQIEVSSLSFSRDGKLLAVGSTPGIVDLWDVENNKKLRSFQGGSSVSPDLRYSTAETHHQFESIVPGGARESRGMPAFKDVLKREQLPALQAYILSGAAAAANPAK